MDIALTVNAVIVWVVILLNLLLTLAVVRKVNDERNTSRSNPTNPSVGLPAGEHAPAFTAKSLAGTTVDLSDFAGKATIFLFVSPTCGPCRGVLEVFPRLEIEARRMGVSVAIVSTGDTAGTQRLADEFGVSSYILVAGMGENSFATDYHVIGTPSYVMIDESGMVVRSGFPTTATRGKEWDALFDAWRTHRGEQQHLMVAHG